MQFYVMSSTQCIISLLNFVVLNLKEQTSNIMPSTKYE